MVLPAQQTDVQPAMQEVPSTPPTAQEAAIAPTQENWMDWVDEEYRDSPMMKDLSSHKEPKDAFKQLAKQAVNSQKLIGKKSPDYSAPDEQILQFRSTLGEVKPEQLQLPKDENGQPLNVPEDIDVLVKDIVAKRKLGNSDYEAITKDIASVLAKAPEMCQQQLVQSYGEEGAKKIGMVCDRVCGLMGEEGKVLSEAAKTNPQVAVAISKLGSYFGESSIPQSTMQTQKTGDFNSINTLAQSKLMEYSKASKEHGAHSPEAIALHNEYMTLSKQVFDMQQQQGGGQPAQHQFWTPTGR